MASRSVAPSGRPPGALVLEDADREYSSFGVAAPMTPPPKARKTELCDIVGTAVKESKNARQARLRKYARDKGRAACAVELQVVECWTSTTTLDPKKTEEAERTAAEWVASLSAPSSAERLVGNDTFESVVQEKVFETTEAPMLATLGRGSSLAVDGIADVPTLKKRGSGSSVFVDGSLEDAGTSVQGDAVLVPQSGKGEILWKSDTADEAVDAFWTAMHTFLRDGPVRFWSTFEWIEWSFRSILCQQINFLEILLRNPEAYGVGYTAVDETMHAVCTALAIHDQDASMLPEEPDLPEDDRLNLLARDRTMLDLERKFASYELLFEDYLAHE